MISIQEAAEALKEASAAEKRSAEAYNYSQAVPYCFIWSAVWFLGYGAQALIPPGQWLGWWWLVLSLTGAALSVGVGRMQNAHRSGRDWRMGLLFLILWCFTGALFSVMQPKTGLQVGAYFPLLFSAIYAAVGLWLGLRYVLVGIFVGVATLGAYFFLREYFFHWMAIVGGGSLLLTGLWMRKA